MISGALLLLLTACRQDGSKPAAPTPAAQDERPVADLHTALGTTRRVIVRGRVLRRLEPSDLPRVQASQRELDHAEVELSLVGEDGAAALTRSFRASEEGMLEAALDFPEVSPGLWTVVAKRGDQEIGRAPVRLLAAGHADPVVRSDIDLTYLVTDFHSAGGMAKLLTLSAAERVPLAGMPEVYRALQGSSPRDYRPITFLSGSPTFFKQCLEGRMALDRIRPSLLVLKPMKELASGGEVPLGELKAALEEQIGYKLTWLLKLRAEIPPETPEILMGDDSEADFVVYNLYARLTRGELELSALMTELERLSVAQVWRDDIARVAPAALAALGGRAPVQAIYIHETGHPSAIPLEPWVLPDLTRLHPSAWSLALDLQEEGWISGDALQEIGHTLLNDGETLSRMEEEAMIARERGWLRSDL